MPRQHLRAGLSRLPRRVAVEAAGDPAHSLARNVPGPEHVPLAVVVAGHATARGQKVENLLAALGATTAADEIVCFADADALWPRETLSTLVRELSAWDEPVVLSGYRWKYPSAPRAGAALAAATSLSVAAIANSPRWDLAWGGTMAAKRATLERRASPTTCRCRARSGPSAST